MELSFHGGVGEIGGNCFRVDSGGASVLLDFGISFKRYGQAFAEFLKPRKLSGMGDWLLSGVAPELAGVYRQDYRARVGGRPEARGIDAVVVSHPHIDHLGLVPLLRPDVAIASSPTALGVAKAIEETGGSFDQTDFTTYTPQFEFRQTARGGLSKATRQFSETVRRPWHTAPRLELDGLTAHLLPVDHSIHGARGILLEGNAQVAYSGDLRMHGRHREWTERWIRRCAGVDILLLEGTNVVGPEIHRKPDLAEDMRMLDDFKALDDETEAGVEKFIADGIAGETGFVFIAYPQRDLDRVESFIAAAKRTGRRLCLTPKQAYLLDTLAAMGGELDEAVPRTTDPDVRIYVPRKGWGLVERADLWEEHPNLVEAEYQGWERTYLRHPNRVLRSDIAADPGRYMVFADIWNLTELHEFDERLAEVGGTYVHSKTEPFNEEMVQDRQRLVWWLRRWNLKPVAAHVSGHARLDELEHMAEEIGAKHVVPIHTEDPAYFAQRLGARAVEPRLGAAIGL